MTKLPLIIALLSLLSLAPKVEPWKRVTISGYIRNEEGFALFGTEDKRLLIETPNQWGFGVTNQLAFASDADYKQAEKMVDQAASIEGYLVRRGSEQWFVPVVLREIKD